MMNTKNFLKKHPQHDEQLYKRFKYADIEQKRKGDSTKTALSKSGAII